MVEYFGFLSRIKLPKVRDHLLLELDTQKMFNRSLTLSSVISTLEMNLNKDRKKKLLHILPFPNYILDQEAIEHGVARKESWMQTNIAIIPDPIQCYKEITDEKNNKAMAEKFRNFIEDPRADPPRVKDFTYTVFLVDIVMPDIKNMLFAGIRGISRVKIESTRLAHFISRDELLSIEDDNSDIIKRIEKLEKKVEAFNVEKDERRKARYQKLNEKEKKEKDLRTEAKGKKYPREERKLWEETGGK